MALSFVCFTCSQFLHRPAESLDQRSRIYDAYNGPQVIINAKNGCFICLWLSDWLSNEQSKGNEASKITARLWLGEDEDDDVLFGEDLTDQCDIMQIIYKIQPGREEESGLTFTVVLRPVLANNQMKLLPTRDMYERDNVVVSPTLPSKSKDSLEQVRKWLCNCFLQHDLCRKAFGDTSDWLPTRLIYLEKTRPPRLIDTAQMSQRNIRYITLSHRWNTMSMPRLYTSKIQKYRQEIDFNIFPLSFQEALQVSLILDVNYVWIDALCII
ncbi:hypothetical protein CC80DRAFT_541586 [Byssothecium circinans]|uniref:Heterokaryon incompatibility domain-containing protein n=1 Tax=Byssothecium circinans TaxID=147558 RepID=A0A6A5UI81_9PLEO|nr:hypothetical protein CC80DRAFT_541586 [Byssothecium circinans]